MAGGRRISAGSFDTDERLRLLSAADDPLERLAAVVDFEIFRPDLDAALGRRDRSKGGRPAFDPVLKFRMLVLQAMHGLSLAQREFLVADRLTGCGSAVSAPGLWGYGAGSTGGVCPHEAERPEDGGSDP